MSNHPTRYLGAAFWSTKAGRVHIRCICETLKQEISEPFSSSRNTSQSLKWDLAETIASDYVSKELGFETLTQLMHAVLVSGGGYFAPLQRLYAYLRIFFKTNTNTEKLYDEGLVTIKAHQLQLSWNYVRQSRDALQDKVMGYRSCF
jgi:hypothetical protein